MNHNIEVMKGLIDLTRLRIELAFVSRIGGHRVGKYLKPLLIIIYYIIECNINFENFAETPWYSRSERSPLDY
jgi:hypothetical protein